VSCYDPAVVGLDDPPSAADIVVCSDVLEHVEPECLLDVMDDLRRVTKWVGIFTVATSPAKKILPDGRNAHLIQKPFDWWCTLITRRFNLKVFASNKCGFLAIVESCMNLGYGYKNFWEATKGVL